MRGPKEGEDRGDIGERSPDYVEDLNGRVADALKFAKTLMESPPEVDKEQNLTE